jgi:hypothetical protein
MRRGNAKQFCEPRLINFASRAPAVGVNPFGMFPTQGFVYLLLELNVCLHLVRNGWRSVRFHDYSMRSNKEPTIAREWVFGLFLTRGLGVPL